jgi:thiosulfate dehydrogenase [quinone] large subunit
MLHHDAHMGANHPLVAYGHLLIGLSLLVGLMVRVSDIRRTADGGVLTAHMDFPYIENANNFFLITTRYAGVLIYLIVSKLDTWGLDGLAEDLPWFQQHPRLRPLVREPTGSAARRPGSSDAGIR